MEIYLLKSMLAKKNPICDVFAFLDSLFVIIWNKIQTITLELFGVKS